jgi:mono/diheme cytochrome c family protein
MILAVCLLGAGLAARAAEPNGGGVSEARLTYGAYLTNAGNCIACHTRPDGKPFEGGRGIDTPFGTIYTPNITPSRGQGIGSFSDEDFLRALHKGIAPDGRPYYPAFPYTSFTKVSDDDLLAIKDYLFSLEPSSYRPPKTELRWPYGIRDLMYGWQELYFRRGRFEPDSSKSEQWNRGAYLVEGLGHCGACHGPRTAAGASESGESMTGAMMIDGWYAPNRASDLAEGLGRWSVDELAAFLQTGIAPAAGAGDGAATEAPGPMAEVVHDSLSRLALSDLRAMAVYLKDQPPKTAFDGQPLVPPPMSAETYTSGRALYLRHCSACHQGHGQGLKPYFPALQGNAAVTVEQPDEVIETILLGAPSQLSEAFSDHVVMPSFRSVLSDRQVADVASFIRASWGNDAAPVTAEQVRARR